MSTQEIKDDINSTIPSNGLGQIQATNHRVANDKTVEYFEAGDLSVTDKAIGAAIYLDDFFTVDTVARSVSWNDNFVTTKKFTARLGSGTVTGLDNDLYHILLDNDNRIIEIVKYSTSNSSYSSSRYTLIGVVNFQTKKVVLYSGTSVILDGVSNKTELEKNPWANGGDWNNDNLHFTITDTSMHFSMDGTKCFSKLGYLNCPAVAETELTVNGNWYLLMLNSTTKVISMSAYNGAVNDIYNSILGIFFCTYTGIKGRLYSGNSFTVNGETTFDGSVGGSDSGLVTIPTSAISRTSNPSSRYFTFDSANKTLTTREGFSSMPKNSVVLESGKSIYLGVKVECNGTIESTTRVDLYLTFKDSGGSTVGTVIKSFYANDLDLNTIEAISRVENEDIPATATTVSYQIDTFAEIGSVITGYYAGQFDTTEYSLNQYFSGFIGINNLLDEYIPASATSVFSDKSTLANSAMKFKGATEYEGKTASFQGDSVTQFGVFIPFVTDAMNFGTVNNYGIAGSVVASPPSSPTSLWQDVRVDEIDVDSDVVLFMGGINDWNGSFNIGTLDIENFDTITYVGALNTIAQKYTTRFPDKKIVFMSPQYCESFAQIASSGWANAYTNLNGNTIYDFRDAMRFVAETWGFPFADISGEWGVNRININDYTSVNDLPSLAHHPNKAGGERMARVIINKLKLT